VFLGERLALFGRNLPFLLQIALVADEHDGHVVVRVLPRIFEPFVSGRDGGTGLGLSIVRGVVERHGGSVVVDQAPGRGAAFIVELPHSDSRGT
jgi:nitrogen-specific signal transduction histidine kinase